MLYVKNEVVRHKKTRNVYVILETPEDGLVLEETNEPAYMYQDLDSDSNTKWLRSQTKMEDGRYESLEIPF